MEKVGIRELKAHLSERMKQVRAGTMLVITDRGRAIATIAPVDSGDDVAWAHALVAEGKATWNGRKPRGATHGMKLTGRTVSSAVLEDRD
jgi:prevent-host-death family protein